jgi:hypothetical protein
MIDWPWVDWVTHKGCSCDSTDEGGSHHNLLPSDLGLEGVAESLIKVRIELPNYLLHRKVIILHHISASLGIKHCPYPRCAISKSNTIAPRSTITLRPL